MKVHPGAPFPSEISWFDWEPADQGLIDFTARLIASGTSTPSSIAAAGSWAPASTARGRDIGWELQPVVPEAARLP